MEEDRLSRLQDEVQRLTVRVAELEKLVARPQREQPPPSLAAGPRPFAAPARERAKPPPAARDLEAEIGGNWLNRIGAIVLILGAAFFLKYAIDNRWINESARIILGLAVGLALMFGSERLHRRGLGSYAQGLAGAGIAILYLSIYAAFAFYRLVPQSYAFAFMFLVTIAAGAVAVRHNALSMAILGIIGGFLTPVLVRQPGGGGGGAGAEVLSYIAVLDLGVLGVTYYKNWRELNLLSGAGTVAIFAGWYWTGEAMTLGAIMLFLTIFYAIFASQSFVQNVVARRPMNWADLALVILTPILYFWASYSLLRPGYYVYLGLFALAICAVYLWFSQRVQLADYEDRKLRLLFLVIAAGFLTIAIPIQLHGRWVTIGWAAEAAIIAAIGFYLDSARTRYVAAVLYGLAAIRLLTIETEYYYVVTQTEAGRPFLNGTFGAFVFTVAMMAVALALYQRYREDQTAVDGTLRVLLALGANFLMIWTLCGETLTWIRLAGLADTGAGSFALTAVPAIYGAAMLGAGIALRHRPARIMALALFGVVILKTFVHDVWLLEERYRIIAFVGLGVLLLLASYVYQVQGDRIRRIFGGEGDGNAA